jgi:uncharacterized protein (TIGR02145 family)
MFNLNYRYLRRKLIVVSILRLSVILFLILVISCKEKELPVIPILTTKPVIVSVADFAECGGVIGSDGTVEILAKGVLWGEVPDLSFESCTGYTNDGKGPGEYKSTIEHLSGNTRYYVMAYAITSLKTIFGGIQEFILPRGPLVYTDEATSLTCSSAILSGIAIANNLSTIVSFQIGITTDYDITIPFTDYPITGNEQYNVKFKMVDLKANCTYHYRIKAENSSGVTYGNDISFTTREMINDFEGNKYTIIKIGTQTWTMENLKTRFFSNGDAITNPEKPAPGTYTYPGYPAYWEYDYNNYNVADYGLLYNGYAVADSRNLCPAGWHVPSKEDLSVLAAYVGPSEGGYKLKEQGSIHWNGPNTGATNESGFSAFAGGQRLGSGFYRIKENGYWWSNYGDYIMYLKYYSPAIFLGSDYQYNANSVRCLKGVMPWVKVLYANNLTVNSAVLNARVNPYNLPTEVYFEYGISSQYVNRVMALQSPVNGNNEITVSANITGLESKKLYSWRIVVVGPEGRVTVNGWQFKTY